MSPVEDGSVGTDGKITFIGATRNLFVAFWPLLIPPLLIPFTCFYLGWSNTSMARGLAMAFFFGAYVLAGVYIKHRDRPHDGLHRQIDCLAPNELAAYKRGHMRGALQSGLIVACAFLLIVLADPWTSVMDGDGREFRVNTLTGEVEAMQLEFDHFSDREYYNYFRLLGWHDRDSPNAGQDVDYRFYLYREK